jgi:hypothetical protein
MKALLIRRCLLPGVLGVLAASAQAQNLTGGTTTVAFDPGFVSLLQGADITPSAIAPSPSLGVFPITGNTATMIDHSGGILFSGMDSGSAASLAISDFTINLTAGNVTGDAVADGKNLGVVPLFLLAPGPAGTTADLDLSSTAIGALNTVFGTDFSSTATVLVGAATVKGPTAVSEPGTLALVMCGFGALMLLRRRRDSRDRRMVPALSF